MTTRSEFRIGTGKMIRREDGGKESDHEAMESGLQPAWQGTDGGKEKMRHAARITKGKVLGENAACSQFAASQIERRGG